MGSSKNQTKPNLLCRCCPKSEEFNSEDVIADYYGKDFTEYEYVVENLAIRPAPKNLLDLVPVHSTDVSKKSSAPKDPSAFSDPTKSTEEYKTPRKEKRPKSGEGDYKKANADGLKIKKGTDDFISFKDLDNQKDSINKSFKDYRFRYRQPVDPRENKDITELRKTIRTTEYRTQKQILSELCVASKKSLSLNKQCQKNSKHASMPMEIKDTIETLRFKKPLPQFFTRTDQKFYETPQIYYAEINNSIPNNQKSDDQSKFEQNEDSDSQLEIGPNCLAVNSTAQTEIQSCSDQNKKNLKWKIIINKHQKP